MKDPRIVQNSVIQINEHIGDVMWMGCFAQIDEVKDWGTLAWVNIPAKKGEPSGNAYLRLTWEQMDYIGQAIMIPQAKNEDSN